MAGGSSHPSIHPSILRARHPRSPCAAVTSAPGRGSSSGQLVLFVVLKRRLCCASVRPRLFRLPPRSSTPLPARLFIPAARTDASVLFLFVFFALHLKVCLWRVFFLFVVNFLPVSAEVRDGLAAAPPGRSGMDPRWCPVLLAALAASLCSSPARADRRFGKNPALFLFFYFFDFACLGLHQRVLKLHNSGVWASRPWTACFSSKLELELLETSPEEPDDQESEGEPLSIPDITDAKCSVRPFQTYRLVFPPPYI